MRSFDDSLPMLCNRVLASILPSVRRIFTRYGITEQQWRILRILWARDGLSQNEIAQRGLLPKQSLVGIIDRLEALDLVRRSQSQQDRRKSAIKLTAKARQIEAEITPEVNRVYAQLEKLLTPEQWTALEHMLKHIADNSPK